MCALLHICSHFFTVITVPKTFYFPSWTVSERWSHSEPTVSAFWANGERTLIGIRWTLMNDERLANVERKRSAEWTVNAPANSFTLQTWVSSDLQRANQSHLPRHAQYAFLYNDYYQHSPYLTLNKYLFFYISIKWCEYLSILSGKRH